MRVEAYAFLVGAPVFNTGEGRYPVLVGSIPIRLRHEPWLPRPPSVEHGATRLRVGAMRSRVYARPPPVADPSLGRGRVAAGAAGQWRGVDLQRFVDAQDAGGT